MCFWSHELVLAADVKFDIHLVVIERIHVLLQVVGPPGTGKTDVAVQIISNLYHNFPEQRTLIVTHSNQVTTLLSLLTTSNSSYTASSL